MENIRELIIVGPTASGKTGLSVDIARRLNGEIISADSRAIYKELDIGTAKPTIEERKGITHYGIDLIFPNERYSSIKFKHYTQRKVETINKKSKLPIIVGGSGLYIDSYIFDYQPPNVDKDSISRYESMAVEELQAIIKTENYLMPENSSNKLHLVNSIIRQGKLPQKNNKLSEGTLIVGIRPDRTELLNRIKSRADSMFINGVIEEAHSAFKKYGYEAPGLRGGIYAELVDYFKGMTDINSVKEKFIKSDMHLAKRQITWFKRNQYINWFSSANDAKKFIGLLN